MGGLAQWGQVPGLGRQAGRAWPGRRGRALRFRRRVLDHRPAGGHPRAARTPGHPLQQCRGTGRRGSAAHDTGRLGAGHAAQFERSVSVFADPLRTYATGALRFHRQHRLYLRRGGTGFLDLRRNADDQSGQLRICQRRHGQFHTLPGQLSGSVQCARELLVAGRY